ncbi:MAG: helix-turn-helix transcriptional regulator [Xanthomonadales bacterium]|nr:helix-turn-helix transcriptional regulator [Xanthomonadales bacterium]
MKRTSLSTDACPIARSLDLVGEWWSLLILRESFSGVRRFKDFEQRLGIARNILSTRLKKLTEAGVLERRPSTEDAREVDYRLTPMGRELGTVLIALAQWGQRWTDQSGDAPHFVNRHSGSALQPLQLIDADGVVLQLRDIAMVVEKAAASG